MTYGITRVESGDRQNTTSHRALHNAVADALDDIDSRLDTLEVGGGGGGGGGGGASVLLASTPFTTTPSIVLDGILDSDCDTWDISISVASASSGTPQVSLQARDSGANVTSAVYTGTGIAKGPGGGIVGWDVPGTSVPLVYVGGPSVTFTAKIRLSRRAATHYDADLVSSTSAGLYTAGSFTVSAALDGIAVFPATSDITGLITVIGYRNA